MADADDDNERAGQVRGSGSSRPRARSTDSLPAPVAQAEVTPNERRINCWSDDGPPAKCAKSFEGSMLPPKRQPSEPGLQGVYDLYTTSVPQQERGIPRPCAIEELRQASHLTTQANDGIQSITWTPSLFPSQSQRQELTTSLAPRALSPPQPPRQSSSDDSESHAQSVQPSAGRKTSQTAPLTQSISTPASTEATNSAAASSHPGVGQPPTANRRPIVINLGSEPDEHTYETKYPAEHNQTIRFEDEVYCYPCILAKVPFDPPSTYIHQYFKRAFTQFMLTQRRQRRVRPRRIDVWVNPTLEHRFRNFQRKLEADGKDAREMFTFHGSEPERLRAIAFEGFLVGGKVVQQAHGDVHGQGIYTSMGVDDTIQYSKRGRAVMVCLGLPGTQKTKDEPDADSWKPRPQWRVFRSPDQLLPLAIITY
eukprot:TRINITY_DN11380_c0_g1_i3.p1 TRINITY_DN11380_c0_g1~~TRINITY_DN11380_c0_g1_i3.p1  ORF type:complete len:424 (+),score=64.80 TRINITY_DN11380_c0_g1_i3:243-1514(+)